MTKQYKQLTIWWFTVNIKLAIYTKYRVYCMFIILLVILIECYSIIELIIKIIINSYSHNNNRYIDISSHLNKFYDIYCTNMKNLFIKNTVINVKWNENKQKKKSLCSSYTKFINIFSSFEAAWKRERER